MGFFKSKFGRSNEQVNLGIFMSSLGVSLEESVRCLSSREDKPEAVLDAEFECLESPSSIASPSYLTHLSEIFSVPMRLRHQGFQSLEELSCPCILVLDNGKSAILMSASDSRATVRVGDKEIIARVKEVHRVTEKVVEVDLPQPQVRTDKTVQKKGPVQNAKETRVKTAAGKKIDTDGLTKNGLRSLTRHILKYHSGTISLILIAAFIGNLMMIALPLFVMSVYDRVIPHNAIETLWALAIGVLIAISIDLGVRYVRLKLSDSVSLAVSSGLQIQLLKSLANSKLADTPKETSVWVTSFRDLDSTVALVPALIPALAVDLPFVCIVLALIYAVAGPVVFAPIAGILFFGVWTVLGTRTISKNGALESQNQNIKTETLAEASMLIRTLKTVGSELELQSRIQEILRKSVSPIHKLRLHSAYQPQVTMLSVQIVMVIAIIIGVYEISTGQMSVGALAASTLLVGRVLLPAGTVVFLFGRTAQLKKSFETVCHLINLPQEHGLDRTSGRKVLDGKMTFSGVGFSFPDSPVKALSDISLTIQPGERIALIGRSGSGKSTLLQLLVRLYEAQEGAYMIDEYDARQFAPTHIRRQISYMPQETDLMKGSVAENLLLTYPQASQDELMRALEIAGADDFIKNSAYGLSLPVGRGGSALSGGERQAIGLARAVLRPSKALLLDEPTSAMDNTTEAKVIKSLSENLGQRALVVATHRASILSIVDRVIWMDRGRIIADGPRETVLQKLRG